jgi:peptidoglycan/xylan/chitin deacetylase (PgdA/CDA1 family)
VRYAPLRPAGVILAGSLLLDALPSLTAIRWLRLAVTPAMSGVGRPDHVALTIDDGPHPASTPRLLDALAAANIHATFFVLGSRLTRWPDLGRAVVDAGHDIAVHGWDHRPHLLLPGPAVARDLDRATACVREVTGIRPLFWRPPHGIPTATGLLSAARLGLTPVLWTADGRDWRADATPASVTRRIAGQLTPGGAVLVHDAAGPGRTSSAAVGAVAKIERVAAERGWHVGPLSQHGVRQLLR